VTVFIRPTSSLLALCCLLLQAAFVQAQHEEHPDHTLLEQSAALGLAEVVQAALENAPRALETPVRAQQAEAWRDAGNSWLAGRPLLVYNLYNDRVLDNRGQKEYEWGLQLPLRRPGEIGRAHV
jgi:hypothetical protein